MMEQSIFYKENALPLREKEILVSERFQKDGKGILWKIRAITEEKNAEIKKSRRNKEKEYLAEVLAECVVFPDLHNAALQDNYGVVGAGALLEKMLTTGEFAFLKQEIEEMNQ